MEIMNKIFINYECYFFVYGLFFVFEIKVNFVVVIKYFRLVNLI